MHWLTYSQLEKEHNQDRRKRRCVITLTLSDTENVHLKCVSSSFVNNRSAPTPKGKIFLPCYVSNNHQQTVFFSSPIF